jgi:hypothetical protein
MSRKVLDGYPGSHGASRVSVFVHTGPVAYAQVVIAAPPTGGDTVTAAEAGLKYFDFLHGDMTSDDGQFIVQPVSPNGNTGSSATAAVPAAKMILRWLVAATGAEVAGAVNLSGRTIRLMAFGPK